MNKSFIDRGSSLNDSWRTEFPPQTVINTYGSSNTVIRSCLVLLLRAGYILIQLGSVPVENIYIIILQNVVDIAVSIASFGLVGYILAFGDDSWDGFIGHGMQLLTDSTSLDNIILGFCACVISTGIISTVLSGRLHFVGYLLISVLFSMVCSPLIMHWVWDDKGWMYKNEFLSHKVSVKDHGGGLVVHYTGGLIGFIGAMFLGRRLMRLNDIDESSIGTESPGSTITGYIFIALGLIGFSLPTPNYEFHHIPSNYVAIVLINNIMAMAAGIILIVILQFLCYRETFNYWIILRCVQGAISGIVTIAAGVDVYLPIAAYGIASLGALIFYLTAIFINNSSIEDYCNIIAIHFMCGFIGTLLPPFLGRNENLGTAVSLRTQIIHMAWQFICLMVVSGVIIIFFSVVFFFLLITKFLRNKNEVVNHRRGVIAASKGPQKCCLQRIFALNPNTAYLEPGNVGKTVEETDIYLNSKYASNTINKASSPPQQERYGKKMVINSEVDDIDDEIEIQSKLPARHLNDNRKSRFVYTMQATTTNTPIEFDLNIGDTILNKSIGNTKNENITSSDLIKNEECVSLHDLHRTQKFTNLLQTKCRAKKFNLESIKKKINLMGFLKHRESLMQDKKFLDGFITIKAPPLNKDFTSWSDTESV